MEGYNSSERTVALAPTPQEAERFLREDSAARSVAIIIIPNDRIFDSNGYWAHPVFSRGNRPYISDHKVLISCNRIRRER